MIRCIGLLRQGSGRAWPLALASMLFPHLQAFLAPDASYSFHVDRPDLAQQGVDATVTKTGMLVCQPLDFAPQLTFIQQPALVKMTATDSHNAATRANRQAPVSDQGSLNDSAAGRP